MKRKRGRSPKRRATPSKSSEAEVRTQLAQVERDPGVGNRVMLTVAGLLRQPLIWLAMALVTFSLLATLVVAGRPEPVWLVSPEFTEPWQKMLDEAPGALDWRLVEWQPGDEPDGMPARSYGFIVSAQPEPDVGDHQRVVVHHHLARRLSANGRFALAIDPWLVFRRHTTASLSYAAVSGSAQPDSSGGSGALLLPGGEETAVRAWVAQLLQPTPAVFETDTQRWDQTQASLARSGRFQRGALTYDWQDIWPRLFAPGPAWVYAPLSSVQQLPGDRTSVLEADRFPIPDSWNEYGLQARVLWARPMEQANGLHQRRIERELAEAREWLLLPGTQTEIAAALKWAPAQRQARPLNPPAAAAQRAWLASSYVWEDTARESRN